MLHLRMATAFQNACETGQVAVHVSEGIGQRISHAGLGRQIHNRVELLGLEQLGHRLSMGHVQLFESESRFTLELFQAAVLQLHVVIIVEVIQSHDRIAAVKQSSREMKTDEPGGACN